MIIQSSAYSMESERQFTSKHAISASLTSGRPQETDEDCTVQVPQQEKAGVSEKGIIKGNFLATLAYTKYGQLADESNEIGSNSPAIRQGRMSTLERLGAIQKGTADTFDSMDFGMQFSALNYLFRLFFGTGQQETDWQSRLWGSAAAGNYQTYSFSETYEESETTTFETTGKVITADGRELDFNLSVGMSRSFYEETNACMIWQQRPMIDPLVINLDGNVDSVSDQTFYFDLDADGTLDEISSLKAGNGFLALDKNDDGMINDGSELFGAMTGNGFAELAQYDLDGNGWIDEADEIYDKLKVWSVDADGNPQLYTLRESDVGAICLASVPTQFSMTDEWNNVQAMVRSTGFFLHESTGKAGSVQQIDLAAV